MEAIGAAVVGILIGTAAWNGAFGISRLKRTIARLRRGDWREFADAKAWLIARGYILARDDRYPMSSAYTELRTAQTSVAIESDRGQ